MAATTRVLKREGYEKASTNRIAEVAGVSVGSLYQYFPNKQALVIAVVERHSDQLIAMLERTIADLGAAPIPDAVRTFVRAMLAAHALDPQLHRVLVQQVMHIGLEHTRKFDRRAQQLVRAYLEAHADEVLPDDYDTAAFVLCHAVDAVIHMAVLESDASAAKLEDGTLEREICALVLRYLLGSAD
ncbi:MAG: TetR family transcriptional regulator [Myxococcales bacterium]|nr:TetR family transcriptional regulator [Myxococcales bacterium]